MKAIAESIRYYIHEGMTSFQAENYVCQRIVLSKISKSPFADKVLIKGGVVMFNRTGNLRRATADLDFDFIRYDISDGSIRAFIDLLNRYDPQYVLTVKSLEPLHQEDYQGKKVILSAADKKTAYYCFQTT